MKAMTALENAHYEIIKDEEPFYGEVPSLAGVWATGKTLEECRRNLAEAIEDWVLFGNVSECALRTLRSPWT